MRSVRESSLRWRERLSGVWQGDLRQRLSRFSDLLLALVVISVVAMMVVPLPTALLDVLISSNLAIAVLLLLVSIYVADALRIAAFPSILLVTTLFRLGLNISSTRLILSQADAGQVIDAFGHFVVAGNLVVGAVVFLILTIIQFVVIAKGSERVAEVSARFTLDAMPGKQMAIDADLRAGAIELEEARRQRAGLQRESQLYGAMDGAMKFVKGDAIAGILITIINIVGGLLIGVHQMGLPAKEAAAIYSQLTIGDGLVSQIPALLISVAAGIVVTRVASEDEGSHLGREIGQQILAQPRAIALAAGLLALLAAVPGLPTVPFVVLAALGAAVAYGIARQGRGAERTEVADAGEEGHNSGVLALELGAAFDLGLQRVLVEELLPGLRAMLRSELGIVLPGVEVRCASRELAPEGYRLLLSAVPLVEGKIDARRPLVLADPRELEQLGIADAEPVSLPGAERPAARLPSVAAVGRIGGRYEVVDSATEIVLYLGQAVRREAAALLGIQETQDLLDRLERSHPALVNEVVPKLLSLQTLAEVLRRLLGEGVAISDLRGILEALAQGGAVEKDAVALTEQVRQALRRQISFHYAGSDKTLRALLLDPMIEEVLRESVQRAPSGSFLALEPQLGEEIVEAIGAELGKQAEEQSPVILTSSEVRRFVKRLIEDAHPTLPVLSYQELEPDVRVRPLARVQTTARDWTAQSTLA